MSLASVVCCQAGLCDELITSSEKSYRVGFVWVWSRKFDKEEASAHCQATQYKKNQVVYEKLFDYAHVLLLVRVENFLALKTEHIPKCHRKTLPFLIPVHIFYSAHYKWFKHLYSTNQCTFLLLCILLLISSHMFRHNCHQQEANSYIAKTYSNKTVLQCLRISSVQIIVKTNSVKML
jgi:hypothetical protein